MVVGAKSDVGKVRKINQDTYYVSDDKNIPIYIIADGMGGHKAGEVASSMAKEIIANNFEKNKDDLFGEDEILKAIKTSMEEANTKIYLKSLEDECYTGMGTTIILCYIGEKYFYLGHVGDSRAYLIRNNEMEQLTEDHSFVNQLVKYGGITKEEARNHPKKNMITRAIGSSSIIEIDLIKEKFKKEDILLIMTDGITNMLKDEEILEEFNNSQNLQTSCEDIITAANNRGGLDNSTIIAIKFSNEVKK